MQSLHYLQFLRLLREARGDVWSLFRWKGRAESARAFCSQSGEQLLQERQCSTRRLNGNAAAAFSVKQGEHNSRARPGESAVICDDLDGFLNQPWNNSLNVAGLRASTNPKIFELVKQTLEEALFPRPTSWIRGFLGEG